MQPPKLLSYPILITAYLAAPSKVKEVSTCAVECFCLQTFPWWDLGSSGIPCQQASERFTNPRINKHPGKIVPLWGGVYVDYIYLFHNFLESVHPWELLKVYLHSSRESALKYRNTWRTLHSLAASDVSFGLPQKSHSRFTLGFP